MWLTACPVESEQPATEINPFKNNKVYTNSLLNTKKEDGFSSIFLIA